MMIRLSRESMEDAFVNYLETVFEHPEIIRASVRNIVINRENTEDAEKRAFEAGFHDCFSDIDLAVKFCLPSDGSVTPDTIVEIKSVISYEKNAIFPTVYSERTLKQLLQIEARLEKGKRVYMLVIALNPYICNVQINKRSELSNTLHRCISKGLTLHAYSCRFEKEKGIDATPSPAEPFQDRAV